MKRAQEKANTITIETIRLLYDDISRMIETARLRVAQMVDSGLVQLYWHIGHRINAEVLGDKRAAYGKEIVSALGRQLSLRYGRGFTEKSLRHMIRLAEAFPDEKIVSALRRQLGWTHFRSLIYLKDPLKRDFYAEMCRVERWSTRALEKKIAGMLYERTALSKKPSKLAQQELAVLREENRLTPDMVFKDPYFLDFLGLKDTYSERDLEAAILRELELFLIRTRHRFHVCRTSKAHNDWRYRLLSRPPLLSPQLAMSCGDRA